MLLTMNEASEYLKLSRATLYRLVRDGDLPSVRIRGARRFRKRDLDALIASAARRSAVSR